MYKVRSESMHMKCKSQDKNRERYKGGLGRVHPRLNSHLNPLGLESFPVLYEGDPEGGR